MTAEPPDEPDWGSPTIIDLTGEVEEQPARDDGESRGVSPARQAAIAAALLLLVGAAGWLIGGSDSAPDRLAAPVPANPTTPALVPVPEVTRPPTPTPTATATPQAPRANSRAGSFGATLRPGAAELSSPLYVHRASDTSTYVWFTIGPGLRLEGSTRAPIDIRPVNEDLLDTSVGGRALASVGDGLLVEPHDSADGRLAYWVLESGLTPLRDAQGGDVRFLGASGGLAAIVEPDGRITIVDVSTGGNVSTARLAGPAPIAGCFSPDGASLAVVKPDGTVAVLAVDSGAPVVDLDGAGSTVSWVDARTLAHLLPDGRETLVRVLDIDSAIATDVAGLDAFGEWSLADPTSDCPGAAVDPDPVPAVVPGRRIDALAAPITFWLGDDAATSVQLDPNAAITDVAVEPAVAIAAGVELPPNTVAVAPVADGLIIVSTNARLTTLEHWTPAGDQRPLTTTTLGHSTFLTTRDDVALVTTGEEMIAYDLRAEVEVFRASADHLGDRVARACFNHDQTALAVVTGRGEGAIYDVTTGQKLRGYTTDAIIGGGVWATADQFVWLEATTGARLVRVVDLSSGLARNVARLDGAPGWELSGGPGVC